MSNRTDSRVYVFLREVGKKPGEGMRIELGRVPMVGEEIYVRRDNFATVAKVIHLADGGKYEFTRDGEECCGAVSAIVECTLEVKDATGIIPEAFG